MQAPAATAALQVVFFIVSGSGSGSSNSGTRYTGILKFDELEELQLNALQHELWQSQTRVSHYNVVCIACKDDERRCSIRSATSTALSASLKARGVERAELRF